MPLQNLPLIVSIESLIYQAFTDRLNNDPILSRVLNQKNFYLGSSSDPLPNDSINGRPYITAYPTALPSSLQTEKHSLSTMAIMVEIGVDGTSYIDLLNLWGAVRGALFPGDQSMQTIINNTKTLSVSGQPESWNNLTIGSPSYQAVRNQDGSEMLVGRGVFLAQIWQATGL